MSTLKRTHLLGGLVHDLLITSIPTLAVMFGILLNRQEATAIRTEMKAEIGQWRSEIISLRDSIQRDMISLPERVAVMEAKNNQ